MTASRQSIPGSRAVLRPRVLVVLLAGWWALAGVAHAARFRGSWDEWDIEVVGKGRPSVRRVLADVDAFAARHGFVRHPDQEFNMQGFTRDGVYYPSEQQRSYTFHFDPAKQGRDPDVWLTFSHYGDEPTAGLRMLGPQDERVWQYMERCRADFLREFPARYGKRHVKETWHLHTDY